MFICSCTDIPRPTRNSAAGIPIAVTDPFIAKSTRSGEINAATLTTHEFKVWGYANGTEAVLNGQSFAWDGSAWTYSPVQQWDDRTITFAAVAPTESTGISSSDILYAPSSARFTISNIPQCQEISSGTDYLVSELLRDRTQDDGDLQFSFHHILSKLSIYLCYTPDDGISDVKVSQLQIQLPTGTATYYQTSDTPGTADSWNLGASEWSYQDIIASVTEVTTQYTHTASFFLAPCQNPKLKISISYTWMENGSQQSASEEAEIASVTELCQGQNTNLNISLLANHSDKIRFSPSISSWTDESESTTINPS